MSGSKRRSALPAPVTVPRVAGGKAGAVREPTFTPVRSPGQRDAPVLALPLHDERGVRMRDDWPLRSYLELGILPGSVPCARLHTTQVLWEWGLAELSDSVELLVSELVTNAIRVSESMEQTSSVRLWLRSDKSRVLMLVWDANPRPPVRIEASEDAEGGRGLLLVEAISDRWNWYPPNGMDGKIVWAEVSLSPPDELPHRVPGKYR
jgi:anti-sigma regulatory factor (Ser/Thr protein kinase)